MDLQRGGPLSAAEPDVGQRSGQAHGRTILDLDASKARQDRQRDRVGCHDLLHGGSQHLLQASGRGLSKALLKALGANSDPTAALTVTGIFSSDRIRRLSASFGPLVK
jgi:hypothetical protein